MFSTLNSVIRLNCSLPEAASPINCLNSKLFTLVTVSPIQSIRLCLFNILNFSILGSTFSPVFTKTLNLMNTSYIHPTNALKFQFLFQNFVSFNFFLCLRQCIFHTFHLIREYTNRDIVTFSIAQTDHVTDVMVQHIN